VESKPFFDQLLHDQKFGQAGDLRWELDQKRFQSGSSNDTGYDSGSSSSLGGNFSSLTGSGHDDSDTPSPQVTRPPPGLEMEIEEPMKIQVSSFLAQAGAPPPVTAQEPDELQQASDRLCMAMQQLQSAQESAKLDKAAKAAKAAQQHQMTLKQSVQNARALPRLEQPVIEDQAAQQLQVALKQCLQTMCGSPQPQPTISDILAAGLPRPQGYQNQDTAALDAAHCIANRVAQQVAAAWQNVGQAGLEKQKELLLQTALYNQAAQAAQGFPDHMSPLSQTLPPHLPFLPGVDPLQALHPLGGRAAGFQGSTAPPALWDPALPANYVSQSSKPRQKVHLSGDRHSAFSTGGGVGGQGVAGTEAASLVSEATWGHQQFWSQGDIGEAAVRAPDADARGRKATGGKEMQYSKELSENAATMRHNLQELENIDHTRLVLVRKINRLGIESPRFLEAHYSQYGTVERVLAPHSHVKLRGGPGWRLRPTCLGFIVMSKASEVEAILAAGPEQQIRGGIGEAADSLVTISVRPFQRRGALQEAETASEA
jgi:hypothetical protein